MVRDKLEETFTNWETFHNTRKKGINNNEKKIKKNKEIIHNIYAILAKLSYIRQNLTTAKIS